MYTLFPYPTLFRSLRYEWLGDPALPVLLVAGGISAGRHVAASEALPQPGWWQGQVGDGLALDPVRHGLLAIDWLGADGTLDAPIDPVDQARSEEHTSELQSLMRISYAVFCLK